MLAKLWKKILLAVCIIACIFNVMTKLVNRTSLEANLKSVDDGTVVFNLFEKKENDNNTVHSYTKKDTNSEQTNTETPEVVNEPEKTQDNTVEPEETEKQNNKDSREYKYTDFVIEF